MLIHPRTRNQHLALFLVLALCVPLAARADEASHRAKAEQLMTLLHTEETVQRISDTITKQVDDAAQKGLSTTPSPDQQAKFDDFKKQAAQTIDAQVGWKSLKDGFADVYTKNFTEEQLDAIIAFYKTPAGAALLANMPTVNEEVSKLGNARMTALQPQLKEMYETYQKSLVGPAPSLGPVAPAAPTLKRATPAASAPSTTPK
jgi:hypothetical protein